MLTLPSEQPASPSPKLLTEPLAIELPVVFQGLLYICGCGCHSFSSPFLPVCPGFPASWCHLSHSVCSPNVSFPQDFFPSSLLTQNSLWVISFSPPLQLPPPTLTVAEVCSFTLALSAARWISSFAFDFATCKQCQTVIMNRSSRDLPPYQRGN